MRTEGELFLSARAIGRVRMTSPILSVRTIKMRRMFESNRWNGEIVCFNIRGMRANCNGLQRLHSTRTMISANQQEFLRGREGLGDPLHVGSRQSVKVDTAWKGRPRII